MSATYDDIADEFRIARPKLTPREVPSFERFAAALAGAPAHVLDIGCGNGIPVAQFLLARGHTITGIDASAEQIAHARENFPNVDFRHVRMEEFEPGRTFDAAVAWDSLFFLPPDAHEPLYRKIARWVRPEGIILASIGGMKDHFVSPMFGFDFEFSGLEPADARKIFEDCGCEVLNWEVDDPSSRGHISLLLRVYSGPDHSSPVHSSTDHSSRNGR